MGGRGRKEVPAGRLRVLLFHTAVRFPGTQDGGRPANEEGEGPVAAWLRQALTPLPSSETESECVFGLWRVRVHIVFIEADNEFFCLEPKAIVQELQGGRQFVYRHKTL